MWMNMLHILIATTVCTLLIFQANASAVEGDLSIRTSGMLRVFYNDAWGTVCNDLFSKLDADVACRQMGFTEAIRFGSMGRDATGDIWLDDVQCTGEELRLVDCHHDGFGVHNCNHTKDVSLECSNVLLLQPSTASATTPELPIVSSESTSSIIVPTTVEVSTQSVAIINSTWIEFTTTTEDGVAEVVASRGFILINIFVALIIIPSVA